GNVGQHYYRWRYGDAQPPPQPETETVHIHLVALGDAGESGMPIGCDDSLIPVEREIEATDDVEVKISRTLEILLGIDEEFYGESGLYNALYQSDLMVESVTVAEGTATVNLTGQLLVGGVCDEPRVEEQLRQTVLQFEGVNEAVITLNGGPLFEGQGPETETVNIFLVETGDEMAPSEEPVEGTFGCGDMLAPVEVEIAAQEDTEGRIEASLNALFAHEDDELYNVFAGLDLTVSDVQLINGVATVNISGEFMVGGVCDEPRVIEQVSATAMQFEGVEEVVVLINGANPFPSGQIGELEGGVLATFDVAGEHFNVWVTNETTIDAILALEADPSLGTFPNGPILNGPGEADHNLPWSWHLDPEETEMVEVAIEVCDGRPSFVEGEVEYFVETVGHYCPWGAELVNVQDFRNP
ncbi:MAG TPA: GerMN domain-containing protein, partial [Thermomicrobiales bacterium]|nr:GerMN domain-containing protein [Thermomicrobiales bacterium]